MRGKKSCYLFLILEDMDFMLSLIVLKRAKKGSDSELQKLLKAT